MSALHPFVRAFEALGRSLHEEAERRFPREGRVAPPRVPAYESVPVALILGSLAQAFEGAAIDLKQQIASDLARLNAGPGRLDESDDR